MYSIVGKNVARLDALEKVTGRAVYAIDLKLPRTLHGKVLRSPYAHARILRIDTSRAESLPGVKAVITRENTPERRDGVVILDQHILALHVVRYVGEPVAAVAAEAPEVAEEALDLIDVEYEELPAVFDAEEVMGPNPRAVIHPYRASYEQETPLGGRPIPFDPRHPNVFNHFEMHAGDVAKGFREADLVLENRFTKAKVQHCQMEPHTAIAQVDPDGRITVWTGRQGIHRTRGHLAAWLGIPPSQVRVISPYVGGGFGGKEVFAHEFLAVLLAQKTGRPVRISLTREEVFTGTVTDVQSTIWIKDGVRKDGTVVAREIKIILKGGAYADLIPMTVRGCTFAAVGSYRIPNLKIDSYGVYTNEPAAGPFRGVAVPHVVWAAESQMDILAEKLGMDPVEIRRRNLLCEGDKNAHGEIVHSTAARECLERVAQFIEWGERLQQGPGPWRRGKGIAVGNKHGLAPAACSAIVKVNDDGSIEVRHGADEIGQGANTVLAQIAAEEFRIPLENVKVTFGDTAFAPYDLGSTGSKTTYHTGNAVRLACQDAKCQMFELASGKLEVPVSELETSGGRIHLAGYPDTGIAIADLFVHDRARGKYLPEVGEILGKATWVQPGTPMDPITGQISPELASEGRRVNSFYIHGAQAAEVAVNEETGEVKVLRLASAFDMGQPINPKLCEGQMEGGAGMGIGGALYEELVLENGAALNPTLMDYRLPTTTEMPKQDDFDSFIEAAPHKDGPFGAKGLGEGPIAPTSAAIANAVYDAVGVRITDLPITREKVWRALKGETGRGLKNRPRLFWDREMSEGKDGSTKALGDKHE
ncbi:MAG: molybdopterin-dependent oxidoreductase [Chloroflexi bacterium]|nr:molybdopterin-dependent oxidoreductase [Chloroflexota bacterium]